MKIIKPYVEQMTPPFNGKEFLRTIERAGRVCYKSEEKITSDSCIEFVKRLIKNGHEAMLEHAPSISMKFVCDRGVSHEIVRHRLFSFAQESTRYCNYGKSQNDILNEGTDLEYNESHLTFIWPCWFKDYDRTNPGTHHLQDICICPNHIGSEHPQDLWFWSCRNAEMSYLYMLEAGCSPQEARSVLPNSLKTEIIVTGNLREWRHFFRLRTAKTAHPQMQEVANMALEMLKAQIPVVFDDI